MQINSVRVQQYKSDDIMAGLAYRGPVGNYGVSARDGAGSSVSPQPGGPCSALSSSMQPTDIETLDSDILKHDPNSQPEYRWDEFGFRVEEEDGPEDCSNKLLSIPFVESPKRRLQWAVELELGQGDDQDYDNFEYLAVFEQIDFKNYFVCLFFTLLKTFFLSLK